MSICVVDGKHCQCSPSEGMPCPALVAERAAKDAEIAGLRDELLREHADHKETIEDAATVVHQNTALRADNTRLQNEVVMPLRERIKVLEDALRLSMKWGAAMATDEINQCRAALGDKTP